MPKSASLDLPQAARTRRHLRVAPRLPAQLLRLASDDRLVELIRSGSDPAFEVAFDRHHRGVLGFCRHLLGSPEEAEDAVQHTFLAAYRDLTRSRKPVKLRPWLYTIARNRCLSVLRARREQPVARVPEPATEHLSAEVQRRQELRDLLRDVSGLPDEQRAALVLAEIGDVSHDEIAQVLDVQRDKVKALVFQARASLIASRDARDTPCVEVRTQLAVLRGGALRRNALRRHVSECAGCREFRDAVREQRRLLAIALPVVPTLALKQGALGAALGSGAAAGGGASALAVKAAVVAVLASGGTAVEVEIQHHTARPERAGAEAERAPRARVATPEPLAGTAAPAVLAAAAQAGEAAPAVTTAATQAGKAAPAYRALRGRVPARRHRGAGRRDPPTPAQAPNPGETSTLAETPNPAEDPKPAKTQDPAQTREPPETRELAKSPKHAVPPALAQATIPTGEQTGAGHGGDEGGRGGPKRDGGDKGGGQLD